MIRQFLCLIWSIWIIRNRILLNNHQIPPTIMARMYMTEWSQFTQASTLKQIDFWETPTVNVSLKGPIVFVYLFLCSKDCLSPYHINCRWGMKTQKTSTRDRGDHLRPIYLFNTINFSIECLHCSYSFWTSHVACIEYGLDGYRCMDRLVGHCTSVTWTTRHSASG